MNNTVTTISSSLSFLERNVYSTFNFAHLNIAKSLKNSFSWSYKLEVNDIESKKKS